MRWDYTSATHLCYVTMNPSHRLVRDHIRCDGRAVVLEEGMNGHMIAIYDKGSHMPLLWTHQIPATIEGRAIHNVQNAMFATALAFSLGIKLEEIRHGLRTFDTTFFQAPGRTNFFNEHPFQVILDYGYNPAAVRVVSRLVEQWYWTANNGFSLCTNPSSVLSLRLMCVGVAPADSREDISTAKP